MSRIYTLPLTLRLHMMKKSQINSFNRHLCSSTHMLPNNLTLHPQNEFHHRQRNQTASLIDSRKFFTPPFYTWRSYTTKKKPPNFNNNPASSGNGDDDDHLFEDENLEVFDEGDDFADAGASKDAAKNSVPSINTVPDYFPKVPMIATAYPVFPKFMSNSINTIENQLIISFS